MRLIFFLCLIAFQSSLWATFSQGNLFTISTGTQNTLPQVALDPNGNALAVWNTNFSRIVYASRYNVTTNQWSTPIQIGQGSGPKVGVDNKGNGIAAWLTPGTLPLANQRNQIVAARFNATTLTWSTPVFITSPAVTTVNFPPVLSANSVPVLAVNTVGNAAVAWTNFNALFGSTFNATTNSWSTPTQVSPNGNLPEISVDQNGHGILIFQNLNSVSIQALRFPIP